MAGQGWEALSARSHRGPLAALGFASTWRRKLATPALREGVASNIRRHCLRQPLLLSNPGATEERDVQDRIYQLSAKRKLSGAK